MKSLAMILVPALSLAGCATISTKPAKGPVPDGVRVYPPQVLLMVDKEFDGGRGRTALLVVPNLAEAYDVKPVTVLARNDFRIEVEDGMLTSLVSAQDTTAILSLLKTAGELGAKAAAGEGVSARDLEGSYGLPTGLYVLRPDGTFAPMQRPAK